MKTRKKRKKFSFEKLFYVVDKNGCFNSEHTSYAKAKKALVEDHCFDDSEYKNVAVVKITVMKVRP